MFVLAFLCIIGATTCTTLGVVKRNGPAIVVGYAFTMVAIASGLFGIIELVIKG